MPTKRTGPKKLPHRWPGEELWLVAGYDERYALRFATGIIVSDGMVRSAPPFMSWMFGRDWLGCATECIEHGWLVQKTDTETIDRERARLERGLVQETMDLGSPQELGAKPVPADAAPDSGRPITSRPPR